MDRLRRLGGLFEEVAAIANLWRGWLDFRRGKRQRPSVRRFEVDAVREVPRLQRELQAGSYRPSAFRLRGITEPKRRLIAAAPVRDRVVHHAVHRILAPKLDPGLIDTTFACLPGRGSHRAVLAFLGALRRYRYVLALDIRHYFLSVDRDILLTLMARRLKGWRLLELLRIIADSGHDLYHRPGVADFLGLAPGFPPPGCGLPIGNLTSQWWGNLYLSGLDHFAKRNLKIPHYQRYMDDCTLFSNSRAQLEEARSKLAAWLAEHRHLRLKKPNAAVRDTGGSFLYLGYRLHRAGVRPSQAALRKMSVRLSALMREGDDEKIARSIASYRGMVVFP